MPPDQYLADGTADSRRGGWANQLTRGRIQVDDPIVGVKHQNRVRHGLHEDRPRDWNEIEQLKSRQSQAHTHTANGKAEWSHIEVGKGTQMSEVQDVGNPGRTHPK